MHRCKTKVDQEPRCPCIRVLIDSTGELSKQMLPYT